MTWYNTIRRAGKWPLRFPAAFVKALIVLGVALMLGSATWIMSWSVRAADDLQILTISAPNLNYRVELVTRDQRAYVGLVELLEPLGQVRGVAKGKHWQLVFQGVQGDFKQGKADAKIDGRKIKLDARFLLENGRGLVPASSLFTLLSQLQAMPVSYQENARQVFLGSAIPGALAPAHTQVPPPAPAAVVAPVTVIAPPVTPPVAATPPTTNSEPASPAPHRFTVIIDASHGGSDPGASLADKEAPAEKHVVLEFARRLRSELQARGMAAIILRDGDIALTSDQRAVMVNTSHPDLYLALHASNFGTSVNVITAIPPASEDSRGAFVSWSDAQEKSLPASRDAARTIATALSSQKFPVHIFSAALAALNQASVPAIAIEISSPDGRELALAAFQQPIASALAKGVAAARPALESHTAEAHP